MKKSKLLVMSAMLCTSLLLGGFSNTVFASGNVNSQSDVSKIMTNSKLIATTTSTETTISNVNVLPTDIDTIRSQFNNFVSVTGNSSLAYNMSKFLNDSLSEVNYINFTVTNDMAYITVHKDSPYSIIGEGIIGIGYNYEKNASIFMFQNPSVFSSNVNGNNILNDLFYGYSVNTKGKIMDSMVNSMKVINSAMGLYSDRVAEDVVSKTTETFVNNNMRIEGFGECYYNLFTKDDGKTYMQIMVVQLP